MARADEKSGTPFSAVPQRLRDTATRAPRLVLPVSFLATVALGITLAMMSRVREFVSPPTLPNNTVVMPACQVESQPPSSSRVLKRIEGPYGLLEVVEGPMGRAILCNGVVQTLVPSSSIGVVPGTLLRGRDYVELIPYFRPETRLGLLIGVGAGLEARGLAAHGIEVQGVDIDPMMITLAREFFGLPIEVTIADGRDFLKSTPSRYDAIILDAFVGATPVAHLHTREAFTLIADHLKLGGVLAIHLIARPQQSQVQAVARTLQSVLPHLVAVQSGLADEPQNLYLFASHEPLELLPEQRLKLAQYGFTGNEFYAVDTRPAPLLTDDLIERK